MQAREDMPHALDCLNQALSLTHPEAYVRTFVDEGEAMQALLRRVTGKNRRYAAALLGEIEARSNRRVLAKDRTGVVKTPGSILIEPLSRRELELIPLLAEGLSNQEIARKLHLSPGTVPGLRQGR